MMLRPLGSLQVGILLLLGRAGFPLHPELAGVGGYGVFHGVAEPGERRRGWDLPLSQKGN